MKKEALSSVPEKFHTERVLRSGSSQVFLVRSKDSSQRYIYRIFDGDESVYRALMKVNSKHLPKIYSTRILEGRVHVVEEYIQGDTLAFLLEAGPLPVSYAIDIAKKICQGLQDLHAVGIIHRDIKPDNIIIQGNSVYLIDFNVSRLEKHRQNCDTRVMGTTGYAAPEQYGFCQTDRRADIFSVGVVLNEMLTGYHPSRHLTRVPYKNIVQKCTQINADRRFSSANELLRALNLYSKIWMPAAALCIALLAVFLLHWGSISQITPEIPTEDTASVIAVHKPPNIPTPEIRVFQSKPIQVEETVWSGLRDGQTTTFYCDMDGNGEEETYVFALDYLNSPHEYVVYYDRCECLSGQVMERTVFPFIWLLHNDGTMTPAEEFQKYLEDVQITIWKTQENQPLSIEAYTAEYAWPGAARIQFYIEESAVWVCQYTATLSGQTLTASADFIYPVVERLSIETTP